MRKTQKGFIYDPSPKHRSIFLIFYFCLQILDLIFGLWAHFWAVFDVTVVFCMPNCVFWQLEMSIGQKLGQNMSKVRKLGPNFGRRYVWATDRSVSYIRGSVIFYTCLIQFCCYWRSLLIQFCCYWRCLSIQFCRFQR